MPGKEFVLTHVFKDISCMTEGEDIFSDSEKHFGVDWNMGIDRQDDHLGIYLFCEPPQQAGKWSIEFERNLKLISVTGKILEDSTNSNHESTDEFKGYGPKNFIKWDNLMKDYVIDDKITIQIHVKILKMTGIEKMKLRNFDEGIKELSDVVLVVENQKFYVLKLFLATQSSYFKSLLVGKFKESEMQEIKLKDIDPKDFQNFLEVLYGDPAIDDVTVDGILKLSDMYDAKTAIRRCEEYLIKESEKTLKEKLELSIRYKLENLKTNCLLKINSVEDIKSVVPGDLTDLGLPVAAALLQKAISSQ